MEINIDLLTRFEKRLNPTDIEASKIKARLIGYGEISSIIELEEMPGIVFKRMPLFSNMDEAGIYRKNHDIYCSHIQENGIRLPEYEAIVVKRDEHLTTLYIAQKKLEAESIGNRYIAENPKEVVMEFFREVILSVSKIWEFNRKNKGKIEIAIDSQISNWYKNSTLGFIDTSTPLFKINNKEQLDPELLLASAPSFGRMIIRKFFLDDVMNRYYDPKSVYTDLVANLYKEKKEEYIPGLIELINETTDVHLSVKEIEHYYREDKFIWALFLKLRKIDRWLYKNVYKKQYQYILPGRIER
jgi:hypothetical protein